MANRISNEELDKFAFRVEKILTVKGFVLAMAVKKSCMYEFEFVKGKDGKFEDIDEYVMAPLKGEPRTVVVKREKENTANVRIHFSPYFVDSTIIKIGFGEATG